MNNLKSHTLLSTAYLPDLAYLSAVLHADGVMIEQHENFVKQTFRNRGYVLTSNGIQLLSIPLIKQSDKELIKDKRISYAENWQQQHWRTITSSYKNSPYFEFFEDDLKPFYNNRYDLLLDYNSEILKAILHILRKKRDISYTEEYAVNPIDIVDLRGEQFQEKYSYCYSKSYYQVFEDKMDFVPKLSCLDAIFNVGLDAIDIAQYLQLR